MPLSADITFETIVETTKHMLGEEYRGHKEMVPVYSTPAPIEGYTDAFLVVSNSGFTDEENVLIKEKTKNYKSSLIFSKFCLIIFFKSFVIIISGF